MKFCILFSNSKYFLHVFWNNIIWKFLSFSYINSYHNLLALSLVRIGLLDFLIENQIIYMRVCFIWSWNENEVGIFKRTISEFGMFISYSFLLAAMHLLKWKVNANGDTEIVSYLMFTSLIKGKIAIENQSE